MTALGEQPCEVERTSPSYMCGIPELPPKLIAQLANRRHAAPSTQESQRHLNTYQSTVMRPLLGHLTYRNLS